MAKRGRAKQMRMIKNSKRRSANLCYHCNSDLIGQIQMDKHNKRRHRGWNFSCKKCGTVFYRECEVEIHRLQVHVKLLSEKIDDETRALNDDDAADDDAHSYSEENADDEQEVEEEGEEDDA